jgi:S1-C subfamily serine protease
MLRTQQDARRVLDAARTGGSNNGGGGGGIILNNARPPVMEVVVTTVEQKTQSARLGLMKGDIIVSYRGKAITTRQQLGDLITRHARDAGQIELVVDRNGNLLDFQVVPGYLGIVTRMQAVR